MVGNSVATASVASVPRSGVSGVGTRGPVDTGTLATEATWSIGHSDKGPECKQRERVNSECAV